MTFINDLLTRVWLGLKSLKDERGQDLLEYALLGGIIAVALLAAFPLYQDAVEAMASQLSNCIDFQLGNGIC